MAQQPRDGQYERTVEVEAIDIFLLGYILSLICGGDLTGE